MKTKRIIRAAVRAAVAGTLCVHAASMLTRDRKLQRKRIEHRVKRLKPDLDGYRIAFITDLHYLPMNQLVELVVEISGQKPDLVLLGGDYADERLLMKEQIRILGRLRAVDGVYGVDGNHDARCHLAQAMMQAGIPMLCNRGIALREGLYLAGVEDYRRGFPDVSLAIRDARPEDCIVLVSHNPDVAMEQDVSKVSLMLSGHTHGGQISLYGKYAPAMHLVSRYGQKFISGMVKAGGTSVYVSRGAGSHDGIPRLFAPPEITFITLKADRGKDAS